MGRLFKKGASGPECQRRVSEGLRNSRSLCQDRQVGSQGGTLDKDAFLHLMDSIVDPKKIGPSS